MQVLDIVILVVILTLSESSPNNLTMNLTMIRYKNISQFLKSQLILL